MSSVEAELRASVRAETELTYAGAIIEQLRFRISRRTVWTDSAANRAILSRLGPGKLKHIEAEYLYIQEKVKSKKLQLSKVGTLDNCSDVLTKHASKDALGRHSGRLGLKKPDAEAAHQGVCAVLPRRPWQLFRRRVSL